MREYGYLEKMLDILTDPYTHRDLQNVRKKRKLETNIGKLFSLLADGFEVIHKNAELVRLWDDLENAEGAVLDRYGANFGVQRGAASDALYRILIRVKMLAQLSGGDGDTVIRAAGELLGVQFSDIELQDVYPAKVALYVDQSLLSEERLALIDQIAVALKRILTAGVGLRLYLRTYRTYRYDLNIGHGAMVNVVRWLPPVSQDRSSRADFKIGHGGFTEADFYPPIVGKDRLFESRFETSRGTYLPPVIEGVYPDTVQTATMAHEGVRGAVYHTHLKPRRILDGYGITNAYTKDEINAKISAVYKPAGSVAFAELPSLSESILGNVYNVTDAFTTTANFVEDAGNKHPKGTNVVVVKVGDAYKYDVLAGFVDLSGYVEKEAGKGLSDENFTAALKDKLDGIAAGANKYVHPTHTAAASGLYKTTVDEEGHVTATTPVTKDDITKLGIPAQDTTYDEATTAKAGLMSAADKTKLDGMGATINKAIADHTATDAEVSEMLAEVYGE